MGVLMKKLIILSLLLVAFPCYATDYYADGSLAGNCAGNYSIENRSCTGADGNAYTTVQAAINAISSGDTVYIRTGTYSESLTAYVTNGGNEGGRITIRNYGSEVVTITRVSMTKNYYTIQGLIIIGAPSGFSHSVTIGPNADYTRVLNNEIRVSAHNGGGSGVYFSNTAGDVANYCLIDGNNFTQLEVKSQGVWLAGHDNIVSNNEFHNGVELESIIWVEGHDNTIRNNSFHDMTDDPEHAVHIDWIQSLFGIYNYVIENNIVYNIVGALAQMEGQGQLSISTNNVIRNNIFMNITGPVSQSIPIHWYNNIFYHVAIGSSFWVNPLVLVRHDSDISDISQANPAIVTMTDNSNKDTNLTATGHFQFAGVVGMTELNGNIYDYTKIDTLHYSIAVDTTGFGEYQASATDYIINNSAAGSNIENNVFLECGYNPASTATGWYAIASNVVAGTIDYNYVAGTNYAAKGATFTEAHGVNGGNPYLLNKGGLTAVDYQLTSGSAILINKGADLSSLFTLDIAGTTRTTWDIGAYEYVPDEATPWWLSVTKDGNGTVTSSPAGISCGATCTYEFNDTTEVTLTAVPQDIGWKAGVWAGDGTAGVVTMDAAKTSSVTFDKNTNQALGVGAGHKLGVGAAHQLF